MPDWLLALVLVLGAVVLALLIGYGLAWHEIGHEPLLRRNCTCKRVWELRHLRSAGCAYPTQALDVDTWRKPW